MVFGSIGLRDIVDVDGQLLPTDADLNDPATLLAKANGPTDQALWLIHVGKRLLLEARQSACRIWRIERRTASRKAALALSIRCQRSATCTACGAAFVAAWPYPPPRSREMMVISG